MRKAKRINLGMAKVAWVFDNKYKQTLLPHDYGKLRRKLDKLGLGDYNIYLEPVRKR